jgi:hypothetical protein
VEYIVEKRARLDIYVEGAFLPASFSPTYLAQAKLIPVEEALTSKIQFIVPDLTSFESDWVRITCSKSTLEITAKDPRKFDAAVDLLAAQRQPTRGGEPPISGGSFLRVTRMSHYTFDQMGQEKKPSLTSLINLRDLPEGLVVDQLDELSLSVSAGGTGAHHAHLELGSSRDASISIRASLVWRSKDDAHSDDSPHELLGEFEKGWPHTLKFLEDRLQDVARKLEEVTRN